MTPEDIAVVQESSQKLASTADQVAEIFYLNLFSLDPQLKSFFPSGKDLANAFSVSTPATKVSR